MTADFNAIWPNSALVSVYVLLGLFSVAMLIYFLRAGPGTTAAFIRRHPIVLLPTLLMMNLSWLLHQAPLLTATTPAYRAMGLTARFSILLMLELFISPVSVWGTVYLTHAIADARRPGPSFAQAWRFVAAALIAGAAVLASVVAIGPMLTAVGSFALVMGGAVWVIVNLLSCTWYAAMINDEPRLWAALWEAVRFGLLRWKPLGLRVIVSLLFSGFIVMYSVSTEHYTPPPLPSAQRVTGSGVFSSSMRVGSSGYHQSNGWAIELMWVLTADRNNQWFEKITAEAEETPWPISRYLVDTITLLISSCFIVGFSLIYLRRPMVVSEDQRFGFEVLPLAGGR